MKWHFIDAPRRLRHTSGMNTAQNALEKAQSQAQDLYQKAEISALQDQIAMRAEMAHVAAKAVELRQSLNPTQNSARAEAQKHVQAAAAALDDTAARAKAAATAGAADVKAAGESVRESARRALQNLTDAVSASR